MITIAICDDESKNMPDFEKITSKYYAHWLGTDEIPQNNKVNIIYNPERDTVQKGYSSSMNLYLLYKNKTLNISVGEKGKITADNFVKDLDKFDDIEYIKEVLKKHSSNARHSYKYVFRKQTELDKNDSLLLKDIDLNLYLSFLEIHQNLDDYSWAEEYFSRFVEKEICHGIVVDGVLVCATDAPDMPYMENCAQEIGVNTLEKYRRKGYAKMACVSTIKELISKNICPLWSTSSDNISSHNLAVSAGFEKYCDVLTVSLD